MIKYFKIIICILFGFTLISCGTSFADSLSDYIKNNFEYIKVDGTMYGFPKSYVSNQGNKYYFIGKYAIYDVNDLFDMKSMVSDGLIPKDSLIIINGTKKIAVLKDQSIFSPIGCKEIDAQTVKMFNVLINYDYLEKISDYKNVLIGKGDGSSCYSNGGVLYFSKNKSYDYDIEFIRLSKDYLKDLISRFSSYQPKDMVKYLYKFIIENTEYNYDALKNFDPNNVPDDFSPWSVSALFEGKKVVCDGYSKTFDFLLNLLGIQSNRVIGQVQPVEKSDLNIPGTLHSWVQIGDLYYDPTFDDNDNVLSYDYYAKSKTCFNLNHYTTGWILFDTSSKRYDYVKQNAEGLLKECPILLRNSIIYDDKLVDFVKYGLNNLTLDQNNHLVCDILGICDKNEGTKQDIIKKLKSYILKIGSGDSMKKIEFAKDLDGFVVEDSSKIASNNPKDDSLLTQKDKKSLDLIYSKYHEKVLKLTKAKRNETISKIKQRLNQLILDKTISSKKRNIYQYLNGLFVVEK